MAVCMEHIICDTLIALLIFDFLNAIRKLRHNNKTKLIELMAVCMEHIICDTLIDLLIFDFLNAIRKLRHILYCNVRVLL